MKTDDLRINRVRPLLAPAILYEEIPVSSRGGECVTDARRTCLAFEDTERAIEAWRCGFVSCCRQCDATVVSTGVVGISTSALAAAMGIVADSSPSAPTSKLRA
jgi:hypothetical protein